MESDNLCEEFSCKYDEKLNQLEQLELDRTQERDVPIELQAEMYMQLLAIYLFKKDMPNAKFLWKRIPPHVKQTTPTFDDLHTVFVSLWNADFPAIYTSLGKHWPALIDPIMKDIRQFTYNRATMLVAKAYQNICVTDFSQFFGVAPVDVPKVVDSLDWKMEGDMVLPKPPSPKQSTNIKCEEQLAKLTDFVSFLEC